MGSPLKSATFASTLRTPVWRAESTRFARRNVPLVTTNRMLSLWAFWFVSPLFDEWLGRVLVLWVRSVSSQEHSPLKGEQESE